MSSVSLILPVYNEGSILEKTVIHCKKVLSENFDDFEIILIDDGSTDETGEVMDRLAELDNRIHVLHNLINLNVGVSVQRGMVSATKDYIVHNAVDLPLAPEDVPDLIKQMNKCDVLVLERTSYAGYTPWRWVTSKVNRFLLKILFGVRDLKDLNFTQIYRKEVIPKVLPLAKSPVFTTPEMIIRAKRSGLRVKPMPVDYKPRTVGKGAFGKPHDVLWSIYDMLRFRLLG